MESAAVIVVGGGILGASTAYHLAELGMRDVVLLERLDIANAASSRAAGLMCRISSKPAIDRLSRATFEVIPKLEDRLGESLDFRQIGTLRIARTPKSRSALATMQHRALSEGVLAEECDESRQSKAVPWLRTERDSRAVFFAEDGYIDPYRLTRAYAKAAARLGVRIETGVGVQAICRYKGRVSGVQTANGNRSCAKIVLAAGSWCNALAMPVGVCLPMTPTRSHFWVTSPEPIFAGHQAMTVHADAGTYTRPEVGGILLGIQEPRSRTFDYRSLPDDIGGFTVTREGGEWDALLEAEPLLSRYFPALNEVHFASYTSGLSAYTPDGHFILGETGEVQGLYVAAGCCGSGVMASGGIGEALAGLVANGTSAYELSPFHPDRFGKIDPTSLEFRGRCAAARAGKAAE